jgi:peptidoglycan-associated lipoprotein
MQHAFAKTEVIMTARFKLSLAVLCGALGAACAHAQTTTPTRSAQNARAAEEQAIAPPLHTESVRIAGPIVAACHLRFDDYRAKAADHAPRFAFDKSELQAGDRALLHDVAACVSRGPLEGRRLELIGRADPRGEIEYNFLLGERRANSVARFLEEAGVRHHQLEETSRGKLDATGKDEGGWARDRRVDILLL